MHTYRHSKSEQIWTVGYYTYRAANTAPDWHALKDFNTEQDAAAYASYLNGGSKP